MLHLNHAAEVMAQNLSQNFVLHGGIGLAPDRIPKLGPNHAERGLYVRAKVIPLQELLSMVVVTVEHLRPQPSSFVGSVVLERDEGLGTQGNNRFQVVLRGIPKISRHLSDIEVVGCVIEKGWEHGAIICIWSVDLNRCDDVGSHTTHDVGLNPSLLDSFFAVLVVEPTVKARGAETRGITGEMGFPSLEGQTTLGDEVHENRRGGFGFEGSEDRVVRRQLSGEALAMGIPEIAHESASGDGGVHLEDGREKKIRNRKRPSPRPGACGFGNASAEILEQDLEVVFFVGLGGVVSRPALTQGLVAPVPAFER